MRKNQRVRQKQLFFRMLALLLCCGCLWGMLIPAEVSAVTTEDEIEEAGIVPQNGTEETVEDAVLPEEADVPEEETAMEEAAVPDEEQAPEEPTGEETATELSRTVSVGNVSVTGVLREDTELRVSALEQEAFGFLAGQLAPGGGLKVTMAYDICLMQGGAAYEPDAPVTVTIHGLKPDAQIYHLPGTSAEDVYAALRAQTGVSMQALSDEPQALHFEKLASVPTGDGVTFTTSGFSVMLAAEGASTHGEMQEDDNYIKAAKTFKTQSGEDFEKIIAEIGEGFALKVTGASNAYELKLGAGTLTRNEAEHKYTYTWTIENAGIGTYGVSESGEAAANYDVTTTGTGAQVQVAAPDFAVTYDRYTTCSHNNWDVKVTGDTNVMFAAALTNRGCVVISMEPLSAAQKQVVAKAVVSIGGNWKDPVHFYSISANGNGPYTIDGKELWYDEAAGQVVLRDTSNWTHVAAVRYSITEASNPELEVVNTYTKRVTDVTVSKTVTGNMGDRSKTFSFAYKVGANGEEKYFSLKHGEEISLSQLVIGSTLYIKEDAADYKATVSYKVGQADARTVTAENGWYAIPVAPGTVISFVNDKDVLIDTGIVLDSLPFVLLLGVSVIGTAVLLGSRRRYR